MHKYIRIVVVCLSLLFIIPMMISCNSDPTSPETPRYPSEIIATINIGPQTHGLCSTPDGNMILIASDGLGDFLNFVETQEYNVIASIPVGSHPRSVEISPNGEFAYCSNAGDASISVVSVLDTLLTTTINVGGIPDGLAISPSGEFLYVANYGNCEIDVIDTSDHSIVEYIELRGSPTEISISDSGEYLYAITTMPYPLLYSVNLSDNTLQDSIGLSHTGLNLVITPDAEFIYALTTLQLLVVNADDFSIESSFNVYPCGAGMTILQPGEYAYICGSLIAGTQSEIWVYDLADNSLLGDLDFPSVPKYMTSSMSGDRVYVSCNALVVIGN